MEDELDLLNPETLADWIGKVEDKASAAAEDGAVSRFVLGNLVLELGRVGLIDARGFIQHLLAAAPQHPDHPRSVQAFLEELQLCLPEPAASGEGGAPGKPQVFH